MIFKSTYKLTYTLDRIINELSVVVELKQHEEKLKPYENIYYGVVYINNVLSNDYDLSYCVNAKHAAEKIGLLLKKEYKEKYRNENKSFRIKKEILLINEI